MKKPKHTESTYLELPIELPMLPMPVATPPAESDFDKKPNWDVDLTVHNFEIQIV